MKRGFLFVLLSAAVGGLTAFAVVKSMSEGQPASQMSETAQFRTVNLSHENWPDFTYAAESAVDAVVYVKVTSTQTQPQAPSSIFDYFFGFPQSGPQQREKAAEAAVKGVLTNMLTPADSQHGVAIAHLEPQQNQHLHQWQNSLTGGKEGTKT